MITDDVRQFALTSSSALDSALQKVNAVAHLSTLTIESQIRYITEAEYLIEFAQKNLALAKKMVQP